MQSGSDLVSQQDTSMGSGYGGPGSPVFSASHPGVWGNTGHPSALSLYAEMHRSRTLDDDEPAPKPAPSVIQQQQQPAAADPSFSSSPSSRSRAPQLRVYPDVDVADLLDQMPSKKCVERLNLTTSALKPPQIPPELLKSEDLPQLLRQVLRKVVGLHLNLRLSQTMQRHCNRLLACTRMRGPAVKAGFTNQGPPRLCGKRHLGLRI